MDPEVNKLLELMYAPGPKATALIEKASKFAKKAYGEKGHEGISRWNHAYETAAIIARLGLGRRTISSALLNGILTETSVPEAEIEKEFGSEILYTAGNKKVDHSPLPS